MLHAYNRNSYLDLCKVCIILKLTSNFVSLIYIFQQTFEVTEKVYNNSSRILAAFLVFMQGLSNGWIESDVIHD